MEALTGSNIRWLVLEKKSDLGTQPCYSVGLSSSIHCCKIRLIITIECKKCLAMFLQGITLCCTRLALSAATMLLLSQCTILSHLLLSLQSPVHCIIASPSGSVSLLTICTAASRIVHKNNVTLAKSTMNILVRLRTGTQQKSK